MVTLFDDSLAGIERCQSPLEGQLAHAFSKVSRFEWRTASDHRWEVGRWPGWFLALLAQPQYDRYRADFGICSWMHLDDEAPPFIVIVEVDGHDFHEKTKEQARRDKSRDRFMTATEARIFRFTGSEIYIEMQKLVQWRFLNMSSSANNSILMKSSRSSWRELRSARRGPNKPI